MSGYYSNSPANTPGGPPRPYPFAHGPSSSSTPTTRSPAHQVPTSNVRNAGRSSSATHSPAFTPAQRDRQARGKDPYARPGSPSDDYDYDAAMDIEMDFEDFSAPPRPSANNSRNFSSGSGVSRLFTSSHSSRRGPPPSAARYHVTAASDSSDPDYDEYDPRDDDFVGGIGGNMAMAASSRYAAPRGHLRPVAGAGRQRGEAFESWRKREHARDILERPELLMWYAASRDDSVPGTRLHFTRILCGYDDDEGSHASKGRTPRKSSGMGSRR